MRARVGLVVACVLVSACGVRTQDAPQPLPADLLPSELRASAGPDRAAVTVPVYLVQEGRLVREERAAPRRTVDQALRALLAAGDADGARRSAVPPGTVVERLSGRGGRLSIGLSAHFAQVRGRDQLLAVAQVVWTATEFPPVREVDVLVGGRRIELPVEQGEVSSGPAGRDDYRSVGPAR